MLVGITYFTLPETVLAACAGAAAATWMNRKSRPTAVQAVFNSANLVLSAFLCYHLARNWLALTPGNLPVMLALVSAVYFVSTTMVVSGVLSLLNGTPLREVSARWYPWTFPYYLVGAMAVGAVASGLASAPVWVALLPMAYMIHFFLALSRTTAGRAARPEPDTLPAGARCYAYLVIAAGAGAGLNGLADLSRIDWPRLAGFALVTVVTAGAKIRLPGLTGPLSFGFVPVLVAILQFSLAEAVILAAATSAVQVIWHARVRPTPLQIAFNMACMLVATAAVYHAAQWAFRGPALSIAKLAAVTGLLYLCNSLMVAGILSLLQKAPVLTLWRECYFWTLPYYSVGAVIVAVMIAALNQAGWQFSLAVLPVSGMLYYTYRTHVDSAARRQQPAALS
jgi:hypothetical protein